MNHKKDFPLGRQLFFICRMRATRADQLMDQFGLYRGQARVLLILSHEDGLMQSQIAEKLEISPAATSKVIKRLETLEYLERRPGDRDERVWRVYLLPKGRALIDEIHAAFNQLDQLCFQGISPEDLAHFGRVLNQIQNNLHPCREE